MAHRSRLEKSDPRMLRAMMDRSSQLSREHRIGSVFVGIAGREGDLLVADFIAYVESALRVEDAIFPLTRERAVLLLMDVERDQAQEIVERVFADFSSRFPSSTPLDVRLSYFGVPVDAACPTAKDVLPVLFSR